MLHIYFSNYYKIFIDRQCDTMSKEDFKDFLNEDAIYNPEEHSKLILLMKHNICQNMRIARKISGMAPDRAAELLGIEPQSLRRIEAENDRDEFSTKVLITAIMIYDVDANFYFQDWKKNEILLSKKNR